MLSKPAVAALNHLFVQSGWALQQLARFSGRTARFNIAPFSFACTIQDDGTLRVASQHASADATCTIPPTLLPRLALHDEAAYDLIHGAGDAAFLAEIIFLGRNLRWDAADDISRVAGDIAAERMVQLAHSKQQQLRDAALNLSQAVAEYWTEESPLLAKPADIAALGQQVNQLHDDVAQLEQRINRLTHS